MSCDSLGCKSQGRTQRQELVAERWQEVGLTLSYQTASGYEYAHNEWIVNQRWSTTHAVARDSMLRGALHSGTGIAVYQYRSYRH